MPQAAVPPSPPAGTNPRDRHLAKNKPPALDNRREPARIEATPTDPNLKRYQAASAHAGESGGALRVMLMILLGLVITVLILAVLVLFVPSVRSLLPQSIQRLLISGEPITEPATTTPAPATTTPVPATTTTAPATTTTPTGGTPDGK
jgi:hypothetical protein